MKYERINEISLFLESLDFLIPLSYSHYSLPEFKNEDEYTIQIHVAYSLYYVTKDYSQNPSTVCLPFNKFFKMCSSETQIKILFHMDKFLKYSSVPK